MTNRLPLTIVLFLAACGGAATVTNEMTANEANAQTAKAQPNPAARSNAAAGPDLSGKWGGQFDGGEGTATITKQNAPGRYSVSVEVVGERGCSGAVGGNAAMNGGRLILSEPVPEGRGMCRITMTPRGGALDVSSNNCMYFHGMSCGFSGTLARRNAPVAQAVPAGVTPTSAPSFVGVWTFRGDGCDGDTGMTINRDGTYTAYEESGRWTSAGKTLTFTALETYVMGEVGSERRIANPKAHRWQITSHTAKAYSARGSDGSMMHLVRCR